MFWRNIGACALSAVLALLLLCAAVSCSAGAKRGLDELHSSATEEQRLVVEESPFSLTGEEQVEMSEQLALLGAAFARSAEGLVLKEDQQDKLREYCRASVLPVLSKNRVTASECKAFCMAAEVFLAGSDGGKTASLALFRALWQNGVSVLGSRRFGNVSYDLLLLGADETVKEKEARYEKYGYAWYRTEAEELSALRASFAAEVGAEPFGTICQTVYFALSLTEQLPDSDSTLFNDAEMIRLLQKQTSDLAAQNVTARQWELTAQLLCKVLPESVLLPSSLTPSQTKEGRALLSADYPSAAAQSAPALVSLLSAMAGHLQTGDLAALRSEHAGERSILFCRLAVACESELREALATLAEKGKTATEAERKAGSSAAYEDFCRNTQSASAEDVIGAIRTCAAEGTDASVSAVERALLGFAVETAPYLTFAIFGEGQS